MGANSATPTGPSAPAIVGSAETRKMTHGTNERRPPTRLAAQSTMRSAVPFVTATPNRYVTPTSEHEEVGGKAGVHVVEALALEDRPDDERHDERDRTEVHGPGRPDDEDDDKADDAYDMDRHSGSSPRNLLPTCSVHSHNWVELAP